MRLRRRIPQAGRWPAPGCASTRRWPRWLPSVGVVFLLTLAPHDAGAVDFADTRDAFRLIVEPPGLPACITFPLARFDRVECEGLDPAREATLRASAAAGTQWIGTSVFRGDTWGFRLAITRADAPPTYEDDESDAARLRSAREAMKRSLQPGKLLGGEDGVAGELRTISGAHVARFELAFADDQIGALQSIEYVVPSELGVYSISFLADRAHAAELATIADRAILSLHVRPRPRAARLVPTLVFYVLVPLAAVLGIAFLVARLSSVRRGHTAAVAWPGSRSDGTRD